MPAKHSFRDLFNAAIGLLSKEDIKYVLIGGVASDIWGRPRKTLDVDIVLQVSPRGYTDFLAKAQKHKFIFNYDKALRQLKNMGMCRLTYGGYHADFIMGYSEFEEVIFQRKRKVKIFNTAIWVASAEDVILYKLLSNRPIDQSDIANIITAQGNKLDK
ncbi:MAG: DUF6036 family nucleotidyltransferase, partial [Planctomycetota bacterium]